MHHVYCVTCDKGARSKGVAKVHGGLRRDCSFLFFVLQVQEMIEGKKGVAPIVSGAPLSQMPLSSGMAAPQAKFPLPYSHSQPVYANQVRVCVCVRVRARACVCLCVCVRVLVHNFLLVMFFQASGKFLRYSVPSFLMTDNKTSDPLLQNFVVLISRSLFTKKQTNASL